MKDNCERIFKEAARYARMPDEAIADHFKTSIKDENKKIKILRGEIEGMPVAFPVLEKDSYVGEGSFGVVSMYRELISHKLLSIKLLNDGLDNSSEEMRSCRKTRTSLAHCFRRFYRYEQRHWPVRGQCSGMLRLCTRKEST